MIGNILCRKCKHRRPILGGCDAFPDGIPQQIVNGQIEHTKVIEGQKNDIVFEEQEKERSWDDIIDSLS